MSLSYIGNMSENRKIILILSILICLILLTIPNHGVAKEYTFVSLEFAPYSYCSNGTVKGLDVELLQECFRRMDEKLKIMLVPWKRALCMGMYGQADGVFSILLTPERNEKMFFSDPVRTELMTLYVRKDSKLEFNGDLDELKDFQLGVVRNFSYGNKVDNFVKNEISSGHIEVSVSPEMNITKLIRKRFDVMVGDKISTIGAIRKLGVAGQIRQLGEPVSSNNIYVAFSRELGHADLRDRFNVALKSMRADGTWDRIINHYRELWDKQKDHLTNEVE